MSVVLVMIPGVDSDILEFHVNNISMLIANDRMVTMWFHTNLELIRKTYYQCSTFIKTGTILYKLTTHYLFSSVNSLP